MKVRIYVEGGGDRKDLSTACRRGFAEFFKKVVPEGRQPKVTPCGSRDDTFSDFRNALTDGREGFVMLLVDSEESVGEGVGPWEHLNARDKWERPVATTDDHAHLMVQCMEAWTLADPEALATYYGQRFGANSLPRRGDIEKISKAKVLSALQNATKNTKQGAYHKTRHGFDLIALINPAKVRDRSPRAERLCVVFERKAAE